MNDFCAALKELSEKKSNKLEEIGNGVYRFDVGIKYDSGELRFQNVYLWTTVLPNSSRTRIYMNSRCGQYTNAVNLYNILKESGYSSYSTLTIVNDKLGDGTPCETIVAQASPYLDITDTDLLWDIMFEVALNADYVEKKYFGGDSN